MTVSSTNRKAGPFPGNGATVSFPFTFKVFSASDVLVARADAAGAETTLALTTDYTVSLNADQNASPGGTVTPVVVLASGFTLTMSSALEYLQPVDLTNNGGFYPAVINTALDRLTIFVQQLAEKVSRSLKMAISTPSGVDSTLPAPSPYKIIGWNSSGSGFTNYAPVDNTLLAAALAAPDGAGLVGRSINAAGGTARTVQAVLSDTVSIKDFGAIGDGTLHTVAEWIFPSAGHRFMTLAALQTEYPHVTSSTDPIDWAAATAAFTYASAVQYASGFADQDRTTAAVRAPAGDYMMGAKPLFLRNAVTFIGDGSGETWFTFNGAAQGFTVEKTRTYANMFVSGMTVRNTGGAAGLAGVDIYGALRNCEYHDVVVFDWYDNWYMESTWTTKLNRCCGYRAGRHNVFGSTGTGELFIDGGRYDVAEDHSIYMNSATGELIVTGGAAAQFGKKSGLRVDSARTVKIEPAFIEGNCIGSATDYHIYLQGNGDTLSSAVIHDTAINDLADATRYGLGAIYVDGFETFSYRERWVRNGANVVPVVGSAVQNIDMAINNAAALTTATAPLAWDSAKFARIQQLARPIQYFGIDMNATGTVSIPTRCALIVGLPTIGVGIGTYSQVGAVQAYGASGVLWLNPSSGDIKLGQSGALVAGNTNEFFGRYRSAAQSTSSNITPAATTGTVFVNCSGGNRTVTLTNITPVAGRRVTVKKTDSGANSLIVTPGSGLVDGAASFSSTAAWATVTLESDGTNWFSV